MNYAFKLKITYYESGIAVHDIYEFIADDFATFRTKFLKRFGNLISTNKNNKQKEMVKKLSYIADNTKQFVGFINVNTDFNIKILSVKKLGEMNFDFQFYKGIKLKLINRSYHSIEKSKGHAKRFTLNDTNQNVWIPNKHLMDDGTIKQNENIDYVFRRAQRQLTIAGYTNAIPGIKRITEERKGR